MQKDGGVFISRTEAVLPTLYIANIVSVIRIKPKDVAYMAR
jgi:hypothetical protein